LSKNPITDDHIAFAHKLADEARRLLVGKQEQLLDIEIKADRSLVTDMDKAIEQRLREMIADTFPEHGVIGEEFPWDRPKSDNVWILDPIDGTASFIAGSPTFGTLIALAVDGVFRLGLIEAPVIGTRWFGASGRPSYRNNKVIRVKQAESLSTTLVSNSNPDYMSDAERVALQHLRTLTGNRIYGGACFNYGYLASGGTDIAIDGGQQIYDYAPFRPIVEGAGGTISDWAGKPLTLESGGRVLAAGSAKLHQQIIEEIASLNIDG